MIDVLFIIKRGQVSGGNTGHPSRSSGLKNSALFVVNMLNANGVSAELEMAVDGNDIDRLVHNAKPKVVVLEAIWCPPYKLRELTRLYPRIWWFIRIHSEVTFLAMEGMAVNWLREYRAMHRVLIAANSDRTTEDLETVVGDKCWYLPNHYTREEGREKPQRIEDGLNIGCFGAVRPMKNQLAQAVASIKFARWRKEYLTFHINSTRLEQNGDQVLKNLRALFFERKDARLVEHRWMPHEDFMLEIGSMDLSMSVSLSESFCIVCADAVTENVPIVVSKEIRWVSSRLQADATNIEDIVEKMKSAAGIFKHFYLRENRNNLKSFNDVSRHIWLKSLRPLL